MSFANDDGLCSHLCLGSRSWGFPTLKLKKRDRLALAILEQLDLLGIEIGNKAAFFVGRYQIHQHHLWFGPEAM